MVSDAQHDLLAAAVVLAPKIRDAREEFDSGRRLSPALAQARPRFKDLWAGLCLQWWA